MLLPRPALRPILRPLRISLRRNTAIVHPRTGGNPFLERRSDRALPDLRTPLLRRPAVVVPLFVAICSFSAYVIFNYQKSSSSVVSSTLYSLRVHPRARELLGDEIQFRYKFPIIRGELNQLHGLIDINYDVKGTKGTGVMRFKSTRKGRMDYFRTDAWELVLADGRKVVLLEDATMVPIAEES